MGKLHDYLTENQLFSNLSRMGIKEAGCDLEKVLEGIDLDLHLVNLIKDPPKSVAPKSGLCIRLKRLSELIRMSKDELSELKSSYNLAQLMLAEEDRKSEGTEPTFRYFDQPKAAEVITSPQEYQYELWMKGLPLPDRDHLILISAEEITKSKREFTLVNLMINEDDWPKPIPKEKRMAEAKDVIRIKKGKGQGSYFYLLQDQEKASKDPDFRFPKSSFTSLNLSLESFRKVMPGHLEEENSFLADLVPKTFKEGLVQAEILPRDAFKWMKELAGEKVSRNRKESTSQEILLAETIARVIRRRETSGKELTSSEQLNKLKTLISCNEEAALLRLDLMVEKNGIGKYGYILLKGNNPKALASDPKNVKQPAKPKH